MSTPPPGYETIVSQDWKYVAEKQSAEQIVPRWNIREAVTSSRKQHVALVVEQILPQIKSRAEQGHAYTDLILIPSDEDKAREGQLTGLEFERHPLVVQFEGEQNVAAFWSQPMVQIELQDQLLAAITDAVAVPAEEPQPVKLEPSKPTKRSSGWFGKRAVKEPQAKMVVKHPMLPPVTVIVSWDDIHTRFENEYGIFETRRAGAVFVTISVW